MIGSPSERAGLVDDGPLAALDDRRWEAVLARHAPSDDPFVYAVRSTRVYCRPTCSSRRPRREQVAFFDAPQSARDAGFRACRRCHPDGPDLPESAAAVREARRIIDESEEPPTLGELGERTGLSPFHLQRVFKREVGLTPRQYAHARRLSHLRERLRAGDDVTTATYAAGFGSSSRLYEGAGRHLGMTPAAYRRGGAGQRIGYIVLESPLGQLLVAASAAGVCAVRFGNDPVSLATDLAAEYPSALLEPDDRRARSWAEAVLALLAGTAPAESIPLDLHGTAFQLRVWEALEAIPRGETRTYGQIAAAIGQPSAVRAVARACATNPTAVVVPCHRVVRADGNLAGYRWGLGRKRALLDAEQRATEHDLSAR
jgi:AraC family transcriptional regulator of adaptative response/methylated-DNA-[protein]-cysteine methyltransferase